MHQQESFLRMKSMPLFKYLRPYRMRLLVAMACMVLMGFFGTYNILLAKPALAMLFNDQKSGNEKLEARRTELQHTIKRHDKKLEELKDSDRLRDKIKYRWKKTYYPVEHKISEETLEFYDYASKHKSKAIRFLAVIIIIMALINGVLEYLMKYQMSYSLYRAVIALKNTLYDHVMSQDMQFFTTNSVGFLMSRITSDVGVLRTMFDLIIRTSVQRVIKLVFLMSLLIWFSPKMTTYVFLGLLPAGLLVAYFSKQIKKITRRSKRQRDVLSSVMNETMSNMRLVKASCTEEMESRRFAKTNDKIFYYDMKRRIAKFGTSPIMEFLGSIGIAGILLLGWYTVKNEYMSAEDFIIYIVLLTQFYKPIKKLARIKIALEECTVSSERIKEILALKPTIIDPEPQDTVSLKTVRQGLSVRNITFSYEEQNILSGVSAEFPHGKTTAIVGHTGSGKTTLAHLLMRLHDPTEGKITLDGLDLKRFKVTDLRKHYAIVSQEIQLFSDTVAGNIAYGFGKPDIDRLKAAAEAANASDFIRKLEGGKGFFSTVGASGSQLSGGQRQRVTIARAFYRDPEILILDEATSSLDNESEAAVQKGLHKLMENRTVIVIAHRLSTIQHADNIIVLQEGRVAEQGTHSQLLRNGGHYATLYKHGEFTA